MVFFKETATHLLVSACLKSQYVNSSKNGKDTQWIRTHSLFVDDLKVYQESRKILKDVNEMIVQASSDTGACYGVAKCAEIVFERVKMVKGEGQQVYENCGP